MKNIIKSLPFQERLHGPLVSWNKWFQYYLFLGGTSSRRHTNCKQLPLPLRMKVAFQSIHLEASCSPGNAESLHEFHYQKMCKIYQCCNITSLDLFESQVCCVWEGTKLSPTHERGEVLFTTFHFESGLILSQHHIQKLAYSGFISYLRERSNHLFPVQLQKIFSGFLSQVKWVHLLCALGLSWRRCKIQML